MSAASAQAAPHREQPAQVLASDRPDSQLTYLPVAEAAERAGLSPSAVRAYIAAGHVRLRHGPGPRGQRQEVAVEDVVARAEQTGAARSGRDQGVAQTQVLADTLESVADTAARLENAHGLVMADTAARLENAHELLRETGERAARAEVRCELLAQQLQEVRVALARVTAERDELRDQSAAGTAPVQVVRVNRSIRVSTASLRRALSLEV